MWGGSDRRSPRQPPTRSEGARRSLRYLPIGRAGSAGSRSACVLLTFGVLGVDRAVPRDRSRSRSEEHTSELQSPCNLVCRLLLEKKKKKNAPSCISERRAS